MKYKQIKEIILNGLNTGLVDLERRYCTHEHPLCSRCDNTLSTKELVEKCRDVSVSVRFGDEETGRYNAFFPENLNNKRFRDYLVLDRISWQGMNITKEEGELLLELVEKQNENGKLKEYIKEQLKICLQQPWTK
jgi:hypothetical protein